MLELTGSAPVRDVSGLAWLSGSMLAYSVSPIYGKPGIYVYDCVGQKSTGIVAPKNVDLDYPNGADYCELKGIAKANLIYFYYVLDVDEVDFANFRCNHFLYRVRADGSHMRRACP